MNANKRLAQAKQPLRIARATWVAIAVAAFGALVVFALSHPFGALTGLSIVFGFLLLMSVRREAWLVAVPGLVPVVDLAVWTGGIHFTESDALVLSALAVGGVREALRPTTMARGGPWEFGALQCGLVGLMALSYAISTDWQPLLAVASDPTLLTGYSTSLNGVRLAKGFVWALLLLPLLGVGLRACPERATGALVKGLLLGLALVSLGAIWERVMFTGLTDFASDYRTTSLFWEMNVGGATLDGWLALTLPFLLWAVLTARKADRLIPLIAILAVVAYACFTTFSRGLYIGISLGGGLTMLLMARAANVRVSSKAVLGWGGGVLVLGWLLVDVFNTGGYRGLGAMVGLAGAVFAMTPIVVRLPRRDIGYAVLLASVAAVISTAAMQWVPKGIYIAYALSILAVAGVRWAPNGAQSGARAVVMALASVFWLATNAVLVTAYWSEGRGLMPALVAAVFLLLPLALVRCWPALCWRTDSGGWVRVLLVLGGMVFVLVVSNTYYSSKRFETVSADLAGRFRHWTLAAALPREGRETWLGVGTGQFAERFFWRVPDGMYPGSHRIEDEAGNRYLRLGGPRHPLGFGELYRVSQRVSPDLEAPMLLLLSVRAPDGEARLHVEVCRKHLLYTDECTSSAFRVPAGGDWSRLSAGLELRGLGDGGGWLPKQTVFSLANASGGQRVDVDEIALVDVRGTQLVNNGDFGMASDYWFFSSDRHHLPWHAKNLWLHYFVEQGWIGGGVFALIGLVAVWRVLVGSASRHPLGPPIAGGFAGFFAVGAFDSLLDAPRLTLLAFFLLFLALGLRRPRCTAGAGAESEVRESNRGRSMEDF